MRIALTASALALAVVGFVGTPSPAHAAGFSFSINSNDIAFGYSDGYWDRAHQWHTWSPQEARYYRTHYHGHYYGHPHDRDHEGGWRKEWWSDHRR